MNKNNVKETEIAENGHLLMHAEELFNTSKEIDKFKQGKYKLYVWIKENIFVLKSNSVYLLQLIVSQFTTIWD